MGHSFSVHVGKYTDFFTTEQERNVICLQIAFKNPKQLFVQRAMIYNEHLNIGFELSGMFYGWVRITKLNFLTGRQGPFILIAKETILWQRDSWLI